MKMIYIQPCDEAGYLTGDDKTKIEQRFGHQEPIESITLSFDDIESFTQGLTDTQRSADVYVLPYSQKEIAATLVTFSQPEQAVIVIKCNGQVEVEACKDTISSSQVSFFDGIVFHRPPLHAHDWYLQRRGEQSALQGSPRFVSRDEENHDGSALSANPHNIPSGVASVGLLQRLATVALPSDGGAWATSSVYTPSHSSLSSVASDDTRFVDSHSSDSLSAVASDDECSMNTRSSNQANQS